MTLSNEEREILIANYTSKSLETINQAQFLLENNQLTVAINRIYYGIFYMLSAVALKHKFRTSKHQQLIGWFNKTYVKDGKIDQRYGSIIRNAFDSRMKSDYDVFADFSREKVEQLFEDMKEVIAELQKLL